MKRVFDPQLCQHSFASRYNPDFSDSLTGCSYKLPISSRPLLAGLVLFQSFANDKDEIFFTSAMKIHISLSARLVKHLPHQPNQTKTIFLVRLRCPNRKLTRKLFHNRQTKLSGYSTTDRIKPSGYSSLLFRWLFHNAFNLKVAQRMGMKIQSYTLSHNNHKQVPSRQVPLHKREDDERVWLRWNN